MITLPWWARVAREMYAIELEYTACCVHSGTDLRSGFARVYFCPGIRRPLR